jgi:hypothetical protein
MTEEACRARRGDDLALPSLILTRLVTLIEKLHEGQDRVVECGTIQSICVIEILHWGVPGKFHIILQGVSWLQGLEHGARHSGVGDQEIDVADFLPDGVCHVFQPFLGGDVSGKRDNDADQVSPVPRSPADGDICGAYSGYCSAISFSLSSRLPTIYILRAPFSARAVLIILPMPANDEIRNRSRRVSVTADIQKQDEPVPPPVITATRPLTWNKFSADTATVMMKTVAW